MAKVETEHLFRGTQEKVFAGIRNYQAYPDHLPGVTHIEVLPAKAPGSSAQVRYELNIIKKFFYVLDMFEEAPNKIHWSLAESNLMKINNGSWQLDAKDTSTTKAIYSLDVKFKGLVPGSITDSIAKANLPAMMTGFQKIIDAQS